MHTYTTHTTLLGKLRGAESPTAWDEFCDRYGELIRAFARGQGLQPADCDDVLQDVLMALTRTMPGFEYDPSRGRFRSFLKTVALRSVFRRFRQKQAASAQDAEEDPLSQAVVDPEIDARWEQQWRQYHLRQAMNAIRGEFSDGDLAAFRLYALEQRGAAETAEALGLSLDQVYQAKSRILRRLTTRVAEQTEDEG